MKVSRFFEHWGLAENPFRAEEARRDTVFQRLDVDTSTHPDFDKILGELEHPSTSIVFGEKGSGKTAIRLQLAKRIEAFNDAHPSRRMFLIAYDDLNAGLDTFLASAERRRGDDDASLLRQLRLVDHMDSILHTAVVRIVDGVLGDPRSSKNAFGTDDAKRIKQSDATTKRDLLLLQSLYDRSEEAPSRTQRLQRVLKAPGAKNRIVWEAMAGLGWIPAVGVYAYDRLLGIPGPYSELGLWLTYILGGLWLLAMLKWLLVDYTFRVAGLRRVSRRVSGQLRTLGRSMGSLSRSFSKLPREDIASSVLPTDDSDEPRYEMFDRLQRVLSVLGYTGVCVILDRVDEPTAVSGDPDRMRAVVWPMMNNKFLQLPGWGFKMLLPIELRHLLFRESSAFFQEARLDKQSMIEQLGWSGATLYDLCNARLRACQADGAESRALLDLFEDDVTQRDLVDSLDQMRQPRDAFKMLYQCIQEHCNLVTDEQEAWRIPRLVLEQVRKQQADRVQQLFRGLRPA
ncbi:MAG: hypothetical protein ACF8GE_11620 [Phycisphaerales bacterium JB043]